MKVQENRSEYTALSTDSVARSMLRVAAQKYPCLSARRISWCWDCLMVTVWEVETPLSRGMNLRGKGSVRGLNPPS